MRQTGYWPRALAPCVFVGSASVLLAIGCADAPTGTALEVEPPGELPQEPGTGVLVSLRCSVDVPEGRFSCAPASTVSSAEGELSGLIAAQVIVGNQHRYVRLTSSNVVTVGGVLQAEVTVQNLLLQPLATVDGTNLDINGVRVFFQDGPTNGVEVANADGVGMFTQANQAFFQYNELLEPAETSSPRGWEFTLNGATTFNFDVYVTAEVPDESNIAFTLTDITAGDNHTCGLDEAGNAYCWGSNSVGQLGDGTTVSRRTPTLVAGGMTFTEINAGGAHTCAVEVGENAFCWGANSSGQLGDGTTQDRSTPTAVASALTLRLITAGGAHTCALAGDDALCWGENASGQVGDGTTNDAPTPQVVIDADPISAISAGDSHTCALDGSNLAWCWGENSSGQVGNNTTADQLAPVQADTDVLFTAISAGELHTCGLNTNSSAFCWGANASGQLGDGSNQQSLTPTSVAGGLTFNAITTGNVHTCAVDGDGFAFCWGENVAGQLGDGSTQNRNVPTPVAGAIPFLGTESIMAGGLAHTCGQSTGIGYCWGLNFNGQLGDGTLETFDVPVFVASTR